MYTEVLVVMMGYKVVTYKIVATSVSECVETFRHKLCQGVEQSSVSGQSQLGQAAPLYSLTQLVLRSVNTLENSDTLNETQRRKNERTGNNLK